jgi:hypothetical protein
MNFAQYTTLRPQIAPRSMVPTSHLARGNAFSAPKPSSSNRSPTIRTSSTSSTPPSPASGDEVPSNNSGGSGLVAWWQSQQKRSAALREKLVALGPAAVLAYGLFDGITYTIAFSIAFLGYEAKTGLNPTANVADIIKIVILMWAGNNATRPFRLAGAAALAPFMDRVMLSLQERLRLPSKMVSFFMIVAVVAAVCLSIVGGLFLSRYVQG